MQIRGSREASRRELLLTWPDVTGLAPATATAKGLVLPGARKSPSVPRGLQSARSSCYWTSCVSVIEGFLPSRFFVSLYPIYHYICLYPDFLHAREETFHPRHAKLLLACLEDVPRGHVLLKGLSANSLQSGSAGRRRGSS